jgi:hypothetical protein
MSIHDAPTSSPIIGFDLPANKTLTDFSFRTFVGRKERGAADEFRPSQGTAVQITARGCDPWVDVEVDVHPDPRWLMAVKAVHTDRTFAPALRYQTEGVQRIRYGRPELDGSFAFAVTGEVRSVRATTWANTKPITLKQKSDPYSSGPIFTGRIPPEATQNALINDFIGPSLQLSFQARWSHTRGLGSCWITTPQLTGDRTGLAPLGIPGLGGDHIRAIGPADGAVSIRAINARVLRDESDPSPRQAATPSWSCSAETVPANYLADRPSCAAFVAVVKPGSNRRIQLQLLVAGGLLAAGIAGTAAGFRRLVLQL